jgi:hypothetical protein
MGLGRLHEIFNFSIVLLKFGHASCKGLIVVVLAWRALPSHLLPLFPGQLGDLVHIRVRGETSLERFWEDTRIGEDCLLEPAPALASWQRGERT